MKKILFIFAIMVTTACDARTDSAYALGCELVSRVLERCENSEVVCYVSRGGYSNGTPFCKFKTK